MVPAVSKSSATPEAVPSALRALLSGLIDYAGMFPPAKLSMEDAAKNFVAYARGPHAWMLGKFVVPVERVDELRGLLSPNSEAHGPAVSLSVLLGPEPLRDGTFIRADKARGSGDSKVSIDAVEFRPDSPAMVGELSGVLPQDLPVFCEIPSIDDLTVWLAAIRQAGRFAKIRTGGITPESFPASSAVAELLAQCKNQGVALKATAGLHHPVRSQHPLTYEANSTCGVMHGFLNVFLGAALLECGISKDQLIPILEDTDAAQFRFSDDFAHWRKLIINTDDIAGSREHFAISFGSCSFVEPIQDLQKLSLL
jgi:hypothetical protein